MIPVPVPMDEESTKKVMEIFEKIFKLLPSGINRVYKDFISPQAQAYKIKTIAMAKKEAKLIELDGKFEIEDRSKIRNEALQIERQGNIEQVVFTAIQNLHGKISATPIDTDWLTRLTGIVQDISSEELKNIWARILAGELKAPGKFSLRALDTLKNINKEEADFFTLLCKLTDSGGKVFLHGNHFQTPQYGLQYYHFILLQEAGLVSSGGQGGVLTETWDIKKGDKIKLDFGKMAIVINEECEGPLDINYFQLTRVGQELATLIEEEKNPDYVENLSSWINGDNRFKSNVEIK